jgi:hypothetical protein
VASGFGPDIVGITALSVKASSAARVAAICKEVDDRMAVVVGGDHPTVFPARTLQNAVRRRTTGEDWLKALTDYVRRGILRRAGSDVATKAASGKDR